MSDFTWEWFAKTAMVSRFEATVESLSPQIQKDIMKIKKEFSHVARRLLRRSLRWMMQRCPFTKIKDLAKRIPFSRFHRLLILISGNEIVRWRGVEIEINPGHVQEYYLYFFGDYCGTEINKLIELCANSKIFFDVGANYGLVSLALAQARPNLIIYAFEPDTAAANQFKANLRKNPHLLARIHLIEKAASDKNGMAVFLSSANTENPETGRLANPTDSTHGIEVQTIRLDTFCESMSLSPDVIKVDVEGAEIDVLRGASDLFAKREPAAMLLETHGLNFGDKAVEFNAMVIAELSRHDLNLSRLQDGKWMLLADSAELGRRSHLLALQKMEYHGN